MLAQKRRQLSAMRAAGVAPRPERTTPVPYKPAARWRIDVLPERELPQLALERSLGEVKRRTRVIGRFPGETSCLSLCWAVLDLIIAGAKGLGLTDFEVRQLDDMRAGKRAQLQEEMTA